MLNYFKETLTSKEIRIQIGKRLHDERVKANLSLDKLAELTGFSKPTVQRWEKGWKNGTGENIVPTLDQIIELCAIYKCSPSYLLCEYHDRTKQAFDASLELGLTEESIKRLQTLHTKQVDTLHPANIDIYMCFLNYLICHSDYLYDLLCDRLKIANGDRISTSNIPGMDIAKEAFNAPEIQRLLLQFRTFSNNDMFSKGVNEQLMNAFKEYFDKQPQHPKYSPAFLTSAAMQYINYVFPTSQKQSDFLISDTFLDIVKAFYDNSYNEYDEYNKFVKLQLKKKIELDPDLYIRLQKDFWGM